MTGTVITNIYCEWYAFEVDTEKQEIYPIGRDWSFWDKVPYSSFSHFTREGVISYVTPSPNRAAAVKKAKRHGNYRGEIMLFK